MQASSGARRPPPVAATAGVRMGTRGAEGVAYMMEKAQVAVAASKMAASDQHSGGGCAGSLWTSAGAPRESRATVPANREYQVGGLRHRGRRWLRAE